MKHHIHVPQKHQSVMPDPGTLLALAIVAVVLVTIFVAVSLAGNPS